MSRVPPLSVVVVNWNAGDHLAACLASVPAAADPLAFEAIVIDNDSSDDSVARLRHAQPAVRVHDAGTNLGFGRGVQAGVERTRGELVAVVNPDVVLAAGTLAGIADFLERNPRVGVAAPRTVDPDGRPAGGGEELPGVWSSLALFPLLGRLRRRRKESRREQDRPAPAGWVRGACLLFRRDALDSIGGFPTDTFMYGEEVMVGAAMRRRGWEVWYLPQFRVDHAKGVSTRRRWTPEEAILAAHRGRARAMRRVLGRPRHVAWCLLAVLGLLLQRLVRRLGGGQAGYPLRRLTRLYLSFLAGAASTTEEPS